MTAEELRNLCRDRNLITPELHPSNDYYGNADILKRFIGMPAESPTCCIIEHGPFFPTTHWDADLNSPLPVFLRVNQAACRAIAPKTDKLVFAIGPAIAYAQCHLNREAMEAEKKRLGRNLLIFPPHSTQHVAAQFDRAWLAEHVRSIGRGYDSITACLYWKDIESESFYRAEGFECASAGHMFDPLFLNRLKTLLTLADAVISYSWCSAIGYAVWMGKPTMALPARDECYLAPPEIIERDTVGGLRDPDNTAYKSKIYRLFSDLSDVTEAKRQAVDYMWGLSDIKSREELTAILTLARDLHVERSALGLAAFPDALRQGRFYRQMAKPEMARLVLEQALSMGRSSPELLLEASLALADCGLMRQAGERIEAFLEVFPDLRSKTRNLYVAGRFSALTPAQLHATFRSEAGKQATTSTLKPSSPPVRPPAPREPIRLPSSALRLLNLGCGSRLHPGWVNLDFTSRHPLVIAHDLNQGIPFENNCFEAVYHSHLLEHFSKDFAPRFIQECHRVLQPGGILRVVVPDLEQIVRWYLRLLEQSLQGDAEARNRYEWIMLELFDQMVRNRSGGKMGAYWRQNPMPAEAFVIERMGLEVLSVINAQRRQPTGQYRPEPALTPEQIGLFRTSGEVHQWMYDRHSLSNLLIEAGFKHIAVCRADESAIPGFNACHLDLLPNGAVRKPDSLFMEARK